MICHAIYISLSIEPLQWHIEYFHIVQGYYRVRYGELYIFQYYTASIYCVIIFFFSLLENMHIATYGCSEELDAGYLT